MKMWGKAFSLAGDYLFVAKRIAFDLVRPIRPADYLVGTPGSAPVVVLPGVFESWHFLRPIADHLRASGHPVHLLPALKHNRKTFASTARVVARYLADNDLRDVIIVAHSKGGMIGKYLMMLEDPDGRVESMVAVASPFSGSPWARFFLLPSIRAFSPRDATTMMLAANLVVNARVTSIYGRFDAHIPGGSELTGATNIELDITGHFRITGSDLLFAELTRIIDAPPPVGPPAGPLTPAGGPDLV